jgi:Uma2 family endonuclease
MAHNLTQTGEYIIPAELIELTHQTVTPEQFAQLCIEYDELRLELTSTGELIVMPPTFSDTGARNADLTYQLMAWTKRDGTGICFGPVAGFTLPNGAIRSPDASWAKRYRWELLTNEEKNSFSPFCPDFVVELRSDSDRLPPLRAKMVEYIQNGASLGWLIDPFKRRVYVYQRDEEPVMLDNPKVVSADPVLPGFTLNVTELW